MKIYLLQQFSSNHSGTFRVVGVFTSEEEAQLVSHSLQKIFLRILEWYQKHTTAIGSPEGATIIEQTISAELGIQWVEGMDWIAPGSTPEKVTSVVKQYDQLVEISSPYDTWNTRRVFISLLDHFGAVLTGGWDREAIETTKNATWIEMTLSCYAPDVVTAYQLQAVWSERLRFGRVHCDNTNLRFENIPIESVIMVELLAAIRECRCEKIDYTFRVCDYSVKDD